MARIEPSLPPLPLLNPGGTPAPLGRRALALLLDFLLAFVAALLILTRVVLPQEMPSWQEIEDRQSAQTADWINRSVAAHHLLEFQIDPDFQDFYILSAQVFLLVFMCYFSASELSLRGATLGKRVFGLRAANLRTGAPPGVVETLARCLIKSASLLSGVLLLFDTLFLLVNRTRRAGHDYLAGTFITRDAPPPAGAVSTEDDF
jgi:uncharacterized RDD family membrane protein YckC